MTRRDTFTNLSEIWAKEIDLYSTNQDCIKMLVGNKVDKVSFFNKIYSHTLPSPLLLMFTFTLFILCIPQSVKIFSYIFVNFQESDRVVTKKEGIEFAREYGCLFIECSAKTRVNVQQCFEELVLKVCYAIYLLSVKGIFVCNQYT